MYLLQRKKGDIKREGESICISFPRTREMREISSSRLTGSIKTCRLLWVKWGLNSVAEANEIIFTPRQSIRRLTRILKNCTGTADDVNVNH